nr:hypothetical protein [Nocardia brasiliensis]
MPRSAARFQRDLCVLGQLTRGEPVDVDGVDTEVDREHPATGRVEHHLVCVRTGLPVGIGSGATVPDHVGHRAEPTVCGDRQRTDTARGVIRGQHRAPVRRDAQVRGTFALYRNGIQHFGHCGAQVHCGGGARARALVHRVQIAPVRGQRQERRVRDLDGALDGQPAGAPVHDGDPDPGAARAAGGIATQEGATIVGRTRGRRPQRPGRECRADTRCRAQYSE